MSLPTGDSVAANTGGASGFIASRSSCVNGFSLYVTFTSRAASSAISGETAARAATSWPAKRTIFESAVQTALTPGRAAAFDVSIERISPAGTSAPIIRP